MSGDATNGEEPWLGYALPRDTSVNGYVIERVLGSGGFGITYLAHDLLGQPFAIKEYYPRQFAIRKHLTVLAGSSEDAPLFNECRERFMHEAHTLVMLGRVAGPSEGVVRAHTCFEAHGTCFLVMDHVKGPSLASVLDKHPKGLTAARVNWLLSRLLSGIRIVHAAGLMHRDIKPANIILRDDDNVVLIDFGSSRFAGHSDLSRYTRIYSALYAPPEQALGSNQGTFSDIYSIGAVSYRAIGGSVVDAMARYNAVQAGKEDPQASAELVGAGRYPRRLLGAIDAALAIDPTKRPQTVDALLTLLGHDIPAHDRPAAAPARPAPAAPTPRRRGVWGVAAVFVAMLLGGTAYLLLPGPSASPPDSPRGTQARAPDDDAARHPSLPSGPPQVAPAEAPTPSPPAELPQRGAIVVPLPPSLALIQGEVQAFSGGWPIVGPTTVRLAGVQMIPAEKVGQVLAWIKSHGGYLECEPSGDGTHRCLTSQRLDVAHAVLLNGAARTAADAEPLYRAAEKAAQDARRGLWQR